MWFVIIAMTVLNIMFMNYKKSYINIVFVNYCNDNIEYYYCDRP